MIRRALLVSLLAVAACKTAPETGPEGAPPTVPAEDFAVVAQNLTSVDIKYTGTVVAGSEPITVQKAKWEFVVDGEVKKSGEAQLNLKAAAGEKADFSLAETLTYVKDQAELEAMDKRGGSLLLAMRGTLFITVPTLPTREAPASTRVIEVPFAKSKDVRTPRLPHLKLVDFEAGRFSEAEAEVQAVFHIGVVNPNPFQISIDGLDFAAELAGKEVNKGSIAKGERVDRASTGVFDVTATLSSATHGKDAAKIIKALVVPWVLKTQLHAPLYDESLESKGEIKLTATK